LPSVKKFAESKSSGPRQIYYLPRATFGKKTPIGKDSIRQESDSRQTKLLDKKSFAERRALGKAPTRGTPNSRPLGLPRARRYTLGKESLCPGLGTV
jgi:hypothetical protein